MFHVFRIFNICEPLQKLGQGFVNDHSKAGGLVGWCEGAS